MAGSLLDEAAIRRALAHAAAFAFPALLCAPLCAFRDAALVQCTGCAQRPRVQRLVVDRAHNVIEERSSAGGAPTEERKVALHGGSPAPEHALVPRPPLYVGAQTRDPAAAQASAMTLHEEITALQQRIVRAQAERDGWRAAGLLEKYLEGYSLVEALELQLERLRPCGLPALLRSPAAKAPG